MIGLKHGSYTVPRRKTTGKYAAHLSRYVTKWFLEIQPGARFIHATYQMYPSNTRYIAKATPTEFHLSAQNNLQIISCFRNFTAQNNRSETDHATTQYKQRNSSRGCLNLTHVIDPAAKAPPVQSRPQSPRRYNRGRTACTPLPSHRARAHSLITQYSITHLVFTHALLDSYRAQLQSHS